MPDGNLVCCGSWVCENGDVLRRRRIVFSSARCSFLLARGSPLGTHRCSDAEISKPPRFLHFWRAAHDFAFRATMCRAEGDLEACWNRILTIFDPYTFSHSQGQALPFAPSLCDLHAWSVVCRIPDPTNAGT